MGCEDDAGGRDEQLAARTCRETLTDPCVAHLEGSFGARRRRTVRRGDPDDRPRPFGIPGGRELALRFPSQHSRPRGHLLGHLDPFEQAIQLLDGCGVIAVDEEIDSGIQLLLPVGRLFDDRRGRQRHGLARRPGALALPCRQRRRGDQGTSHQMAVVAEIPPRALVLSTFIPLPSRACCAVARPG